MALKAERLQAFDCHVARKPCARRGQGACRTIVNSAALKSFSSTLVQKPSVLSVDSVVRQRTRHVVKFNATAADFERVMARLAAEGSFPSTSNASASASLDVAVPPPPSPPSATKPWGGLLGGLLGNLRAGSSSQDAADFIDSSLDDSSPLSHAVVMFTATWCGPCSVVYRELKTAAGRLQGRKPTAIIVIDVEEHKELASELGIKALPTLLYMGPDETRGPIFSQGPVSSSFILDTLERAVGFGGRNVQAKWLKL